MSRSTRKPVQVCTARGSFNCTSREAKQILKAGCAVVLSQKPFVIAISTGVVLRLLQGALVPIECRRFKADLETQWRLKRGVKSANENPEYRECLRSKRRSEDEEENRVTNYVARLREGFWRLNGEAA